MCKGSVPVRTRQWVGALFVIGNTASLSTNERFLGDIGVGINDTRKVTDIACKKIWPFKAEKIMYYVEYRAERKKVITPFAMGVWHPKL